MQNAQISEHEPRKGTETIGILDDDLLPRPFQNTNPERGRKRRKICDIIKAQSKKFQNTNPERGRKRGRQGSYPVGNLREFQNTNPGRGRKQLNFVQVHVTYPLFQNTNPGRGRKFDARFELCGRDSPISEHEPRKGTETFLQCV